MKVAILADFPLNVIPSLGEEFRQGGQYKSWFPPVAEAFSEMSDLDVHWLVLSSWISEKKVIEWKRQTFHILPTATRYRAWTFFRRDRMAYRRCLEEIQPDLVHGWGTEDVQGWAAVNSGRPHILSMQGILSYIIFKSRMHPREYCQAVVELYTLLKAQRITIESTWGREVVLRRSPRAQIDIVEYGVREHFFQTRWQPDPQKPVAIFIGSIKPYKGIQDAIAAFRDPRLAHAELWVVGDNRCPMALQLMRESSVNVRWLGHRSSEDIAGLLSRAWCLVLPTRADTSPNVVKEARVVGLPVISTPHGGQTAYVQHGENGFLVEPEDIGALTDSLLELLGDLQKTKAFGSCHHEEHRSTLNPMETARKFHALYLSMAEAVRQSPGK